MEPHIDTLGLQDLVVRVGQRINFTVPIEGSPLPKAQWAINFKDIVSDARIDLSTTSTETTLDIPFSVRTDSGTYSLTLVNELGSVTASANVSVLGKLNL